MIEQSRCLLLHDGDGLGCVIFQGKSEVVGGGREVVEVYPLIGGALHDGAFLHVDESVAFDLVCRQTES